MPTVISESNTTNYTIAITTEELIAYAQTVAEGLGKTWPDMGEGEADSVAFNVYDGVGGGIAIVPGGTAHAQIVVSDQE